MNKYQEALNKIVKSCCPNCDTMLDKMYSRHYKYCPECGQKLDWSDTNESNI